MMGSRIKLLTQKRIQWNAMMLFIKWTIPWFLTNRWSTFHAWYLYIPETASVRYYEFTEYKTWFMAYGNKFWYQRKDTIKSTLNQPRIPSICAHKCLYFHDKHTWTIANWIDSNTWAHWELLSTVNDRSFF